MIEGETCLRGEKLSQTVWRFRAAQVYFARFDQLLLE